MSSRAEPVPPPASGPSTPPLPAPAPRAWVTRRVRDGAWPALVAACTERLPYKAAALFFSLVLWLVVSAEETAEEVVPVRLAANVDSAIGLVGPAPAVRALVVGRARDLMKIGDGPLVVRRVFTAETPESLRVELRPGDVDLPSGMAVVVRDVQPRALTLRFAPTPGEAARRRAVVAAIAAAAAADSAARRSRAESVGPYVPDWPALPADDDGRGRPPARHDSAAPRDSAPPRPAGARAGAPRDSARLPVP